MIVAQSEMTALSFLKLLEAYTRHLEKQGKVYQERDRRNYVCAIDSESLTAQHKRSAVLQRRARGHDRTDKAPAQARGRK